MEPFLEQIGGGDTPYADAVTARRQKASGNERADMSDGRKGA